VNEKLNLKEFISLWSRIFEENGRNWNKTAEQLMVTNPFGAPDPQAVLRFVSVLFYDRPGLLEDDRAKKFKLPDGTLTRVLATELQKLYEQALDGTLPFPIDRFSFFSRCQAHFDKEFYGAVSSWLAGREDILKVDPRIEQVMREVYTEYGEQKGWQMLFDQMNKYQTSAEEMKTLIDVLSALGIEKPVARQQ
jgi:hypothetical protein